jgi:hypothetical protein
MMTNRLARSLLAVLVLSALGLATLVVGLRDDPHGTFASADDRTYTGGRF